MPIEASGDPEDALGNEILYNDIFVIDKRIGKKNQWFESHFNNSNNRTFATPWKTLKIIVDKREEIFFRKCGGGACEGGKRNVFLTILLTVKFYCDCGDYFIRHYYGIDVFNGDIISMWWTLRSSFFCERLLITTIIRFWCWTWLI